MPIDNLTTKMVAALAQFQDEFESNASAIATSLFEGGMAVLYKGKILSVEDLIVYPDEECFKQVQSGNKIPFAEAHVITMWKP